MRHTMNLRFYFILVALVCVNFEFQVVESINEAAFECIKVHHFSSQSLSSINASFSNGKCELKCVIGDVALPVDLINDGQHCPEDMAGICHAGKCVGGQEDALRQCEIEHSMDFHKVKIDPGTAFINDQCMLRCALGGVQLSANPKHEGSPCPTNLNGVCRSGACITKSTNQGTTVTENPKTTPILPATITSPPTTVTQPSISSFSPYKMKLLNISLESTHLSLNQHLDLDYQSRKNSIAALCSFYGNPSKQNSYHPQTINEFPNNLNEDSHISIYLYDSVTYLLGRQNVDLYPLFAGFYVNHKLPFGEKENFVTKNAIYRSVSPYDKLLDIGLGFTIVFSKD